MAILKEYIEKDQALPAEKPRIRKIIGFLRRFAQEPYDLSDPERKKAGD